MERNRQRGTVYLFPASENYFLDRAGNAPLQATCRASAHLFQMERPQHESGAHSSTNDLSEPLPRAKSARITAAAVRMSP